MYSSLDLCVQCAWRRSPIWVWCKHTHAHMHIIHYTFSVSDISYEFFVFPRSKLSASHQTSLVRVRVFFLTSRCIISAIASRNDATFFLLFLFIHSLTSMRTTEMHFNKTVHTIGAFDFCLCICFHYFFYFFSSHSVWKMHRKIVIKNMGKIIMPW